MSNAKCCVPGCETSTGSHVTLHKFPNPDNNLTLFNEWVSSIGGHILELENNHIFKYRRVCHLHFEEKYWCRNNRISNNAAPTLNMSGSGPTSSEEITSESQSSYPSIIPSETTVSNIEGPLTSPKSESTKRQPLKSIENVIKSSTSSEFCKEITVKVTAHKKRCSFTSMAEHNLYKKLVRLGVKLSKCRSKNRKQKIKMKALQNITTNPHLNKTMDNLSSTAKILTLMQFRESKKKNKGRRFTIEEKILSLSIMKQSPKAYKFLRKIFVLPAPQTLVKLIHHADIKPGINEKIFNQIKKSSEKMTLQEKLCIVIFDEMSLKANVTYNERKDQVTGFINNGSEIRPEYADHAQVFMVRGVVKNYKQPVSYTFSQSATKGPELAKQLKAVINQLQEAGLIVVATICDQGTNNVQCYKLLVQETHAALLRKGEEPHDNQFMVNGHNIVPLYDPPHLIKCIRNNLMTKNLQYKKNNQTKYAKWEHIQHLHKENPGYQGIRLVPKLTDCHVIPSKMSKMKVKYATQVFSQTVATNMGYLAEKGIIPLECCDTADLLLFFDKLFDSVNGSYNKKNKKHGKPLLGAVTPNSVHHQVWKESKKSLKEMRFNNAVTGKAEHVPTLNNWVWTLEGIESLLTNLKKYDVTSIWLRHLNQDPIENFFGAIRSNGYRNVNPTPERFESAFTTLLVNNLSNVHAPGANCENDHCQMLNELVITKRTAMLSCNVDEIPDIELTPLEEKNDPRQIGGLQYVAGYFLKKTKKYVFKSCIKCKDNLMSKVEPEYVRYREYAGKQWLYSASDSLLLCISNLQDINNEIIKTNLEKQNLKEFIKTLAFTYVDFNFIECSKHKDLVIDFVLNISCRFFINNYCKDINKILNNRRECNDEDSFKIKAKKYYFKCYKRKNK